LSTTVTTYIESGDGFLFAALDRPDPGLPARTPVLVCAPWGWPELSSYRSRRNWGRDLADAGHPVLRIDLPGVGNASGTPRDPDLGLGRAWVEGIADAARWLRGRVGGEAPVAALGLGIGGLLALEAIAAGAPIDEIAMWAPPETGASFVREARMFSRMQRWSKGGEAGSPLPEGWVEAGGYVMNARTTEELKGMDPTALDLAPLRRALVLGREATDPGPALLAHLEGAGVEVASGKGPGWELFISEPESSRPSPEVMTAVAGWLAGGEAGASGGARPAEAAGAAAAQAIGAPAAASANELARPIEFDWNGESIREGFFSYPLPVGGGFGMVVEPTAGAVAPVTAVFLSAAADRNIGPNRMWVEAARNLAALGARAVRVDFDGIGESDGDGDRYVDESKFFEPEIGGELTAILDQLEAGGEGSDFLLVGLCSGAYWSFRGAIDDSRVRGAVMLNTAAFRYRSTLFMERYGHDWRILLRPDLWARLVRGRLGTRKIGTFLRLLVARTKAQAAALLRRREREAAEAEPDASLQAEFDVLRETGKHVALAFTEEEPLLDEPTVRGTLGQIERWPNISLVSLPVVSHAFAPTGAQDVAQKLVVEQFRQLTEAGDRA
jgi:pimeloyl-ACP methyl ester carboxylesterase